LHHKYLEFVCHRAAISDPDAVGPENYNINLGPKERKQKEFYNTR